MDDCDDRIEPGALMVALYLTGMVALHLALTLLPIAAGVLVAVSYGIADRVVLLLIGLGTLGVLGTATFWAYLANPALGRWFAAAALGVSAVAIGWGARRSRQRALGGALWPLVPPVVFYTAVTGFMTMIGYLRGGMASDDVAARNRYVPNLPVDNTLPLRLARQLQSDTRPLRHFLAGHWQASDRPPLQTGIYLLEQGVLGHDHFMHYQVVGIALQSLWVFGVWAFMVKTRLPGRAVAMAIAVTACSGFVIVNSFFVWPKLLPAAYLMLVAAAVLGSDFLREKRDPVLAAAIGVGVACAMLGHPGSIFAVLGLVVTLLIVRVWPSRRFLLVGVGGAAVLYAPWIWFGQVYLPPGNYLMKVQLAHTTSFSDTRSLRAAAYDAYREAGLRGTLSNKLHNLASPFQHAPHYLHELLLWLQAQVSGTNADALAARISAEQSIFFWLVPALGLMSIGPVLLLAQWIRLRRRGDDEAPPEYLRVGLLGTATLLTSYVVWALVLFGPSTTVNHQGTYFVQLCGFALGVIGWYAIAPRVCVAVVCVQSGLSLWMYVFSSPPMFDGAPRGPVIGSVAFAAVICFAIGLAGLYLMWISPGYPDPDLESSTVRAEEPGLGSTGRGRLSRL
ncbi:MAG: hypothetical protein ABI808_11940 [Pseudonocardiales bacterium]